MRDDKFEKKFLVQLDWRFGFDFRGSKENYIDAYIKVLILLSGRQMNI